MKMMRSITRNRRTDLIDNNDNKDKECKDKNNFKRGMLRYGLKSQQNLLRKLPISLNLNHLKIKTEAWSMRIMTRTKRETIVSLG